MDLFNLIEKILHRSLQTDEYDDFTFSSKTLNETLERVISNYIKSRLSMNENNTKNEKDDGNQHNKNDIHQLVYDLNRILLPHGFNGIKFRDSFGVKDVLDDIKLYKDNGYSFLHYELTEYDEEAKSWKLIATYANLDVAFSTRRHILPEKHHITKVYHKRMDKEKECSSFKGKRIFPSLGTITE